MAFHLEKALKDPFYVPYCCLHKIASLFKNDEFYVKLDYFLAFHKKINLENPQTFNEKTNWLKLHDRREEYTDMVDKYEVKKYVSSVIGEEYIIPTLGVWDKFEDIDFDKLPDQFVLKCTHDSGGIVICRDKKKLDIKAARKIINDSLKVNFYWEHREYPYKNVRPRIIAEKYMVDESGCELKDYKMFCFNGEMKVLFIASGRFQGNLCFDFYDRNFEHYPFHQAYPWADPPLAKPQGLNKMIELAEKLSVGIPFVRVDFYNIKGKIYFGELTFFHDAGMVPIYPVEWDYKLGDWLKLPSVE